MKTKDPTDIKIRKCALNQQNSLGVIKVRCNFEKNHGGYKRRLCDLQDFKDSGDGSSVDLQKVDVINVQVRKCKLDTAKLVIEPDREYIKCHNPNRLFDCSLLSQGDIVLGTSIGIKGKKGEVTLLKYTDKGDWRELKAIEVTFDDGTIGNPYPNQLVRII